MKRIIVLGTVLALLLAGCSAIGGGKTESKLLFEREENGETDVYAMNADGTGLTQLTNEPGWDGTPSWSPDGRHIAFASERLGTPPVIFVMNADGSDVRPLTESDYASLMPVWSPDGQKIAFASTRTYDVQQQGGRQQVESGFEIWVMNADGSDPQRITGNPEDQAIYPHWSPDGKLLTYMEIGDQARILLQEPASNTSSSMLTADVPGRHWTPVWSPDGKTIIFMNQDDSNEENTSAGIWVIDVETREAVQINATASNDGDASFSPDGKQIVFVSDRDGLPAVYIMDADGQNVRRLTNDGASYAHPYWAETQVGN